MFVLDYICNLSSCICIIGNATTNVTPATEVQPTQQEQGKEVYFSKHFYKKGIRST